MYNIDLKEFRRANNMTQKMLADYLGIGQAFVSNMESGRDPVPDKYIRQILDDPNIDSSMIHVSESDSDVKMPREVFDRITQLIDTVCSQQETISEQHRTIDRLILGKQVETDVPMGGHVASAGAK